YLPITMISYAYEYSKVGLKPYKYHLDNLILHILNVLLVFFFIRLLTKSNLSAFIVSILFGIHPMHVESVAWIAERKDVMYTFFFLLGLISYLKYIEAKKLSIVYYLLAIVFFFGSCYSKPAAVVFPGVLFALDFYFNRLKSIKTWAGLLPFVGIAIYFGLIAIEAQQSSSAIADFSVFTYPQRFMFACYGICMYIFKLFIPFKQAHFNPYPFINREGFMSKFVEGNLLPDFYYFAPLIVLIIFGSALYLLIKKNNKKIAFGLLFYLVNIALVLQFVSVGNAIIAERYTYVSYIGLFLILAWGIEWISKKYGKKTNPILLGAFGIWCIFLGYTAHNRCKVWKNSQTLWTDFIEKYPYIHDGYANRGTYWIKEQKYEKALEDFNQSIKLKPDYAKSYANRGNIHSMFKRFDEALSDYSKALELQPGYFDAYFNRAITYSIQKKYDLAFEDYKKAEALNPKSTKLFLNRAFAYIETQQYAQAISDCKKVLTVLPNNETAYFYTAIAQHNQSKLDSAILNYGYTLKLNPNNTQAYYNRSLANKAAKNYQAAIQDAQSAAKAGFQIPPNYIQELQGLVNK
ncbi:MAG: tetratricopeptide repeat protein, partial [Flavobacteriales bacterium]|nr:tetratricopeptide repeat protein [Flavobacteriales bacterium]